VEVLQLYSTGSLDLNVFKRLAGKIIAVLAGITLRRAQDVPAYCCFIVWGLDAIAPVLDDFVGSQLLGDSLQDSTAETAWILRGVSRMDPTARGVTIARL
jgi:hypothetical protein